MCPSALIVSSRVFYVGITGDVDRERRNAATFLQFGRGLFCQTNITIPDRNRCAGREEALDDRTSDALRPACDDRVASAEIDFIRHGCLPRKTSEGAARWRAMKIRMCNANSTPRTALYRRTMCCRNEYVGPTTVAPHFQGS